MARLLAVAGLLLALSGAGAVAAPAASAAACPTSSGVTVVVDFGSLGGTSVACAGGGGSGLDVLRAAGHSVGYVPRQPGMVCTIDALPDPCNGAPVKAYWSYWRASPGGSWHYSTLGASSTHPKSGSVEGWAFGAGAPPAVRPPARSTPKPKPTATPTSPRSTTSSSSRTTGGGSGSGGSAGASTTTSKSTTTTAPTTGASTSAPSTTATAGADATTTATAATTVLSATRTDAAVPTSSTTDSGSGTGLVVTGALVLLLGTGAGVIAWRRRHGG